MRALSKKTRCKRIMALLKAERPAPRTELEFSTPFELLIAVILSAQCTDQRVNIVTKELFRVCPDAETMAETPLEVIQKLIRSVSYPNAKAAHIKAAAQKIVEEFQNEVPRRHDLLTTLPGVGRKTANVVMSVAFGEATLAVDTHVYRISHRLQLVEESDNTPEKVEKRLLGIIHKDDLMDAHHHLLLQGRHICKARTPLCSDCVISGLCPSFSSTAPVR